MISEKSLTKQILSWAFVIVWMVIIFMFSSQDYTNSFNTSKDFTEEIVSLFDNQTTHINTKTFTIKHHNTVRKFAHFAIYIVLGILVQNAISLSSIKWKFTASLILCVAYSITDEIHQIFVPGRACKWYDIAIDSVGSVVGIGLYMLVIYSIFVKKSKNNQITTKTDA